MRRHRRLFVVALALSVPAGCGDGSGSAGSPGPKGRDKVVVYCALDREFAEPILTGFEAKTNVEVSGKYDVESTKTVGLTNILMAEASRPRCDVFWNNEILNTLRLKDKGLLAPFHPPQAGNLPDSFRAADGTWYGFAARARVLIVNKHLVREAERPKTMAELADPKWKGRIGMAKPLFGTTATHAACLFSAWGDEKATAYYRALKANKILILSGNKQVAKDVGAGKFAVGMTDTDDAIGELEAGSPVAIIYPDCTPDGMGTLFIPNTLAILKGAPDPKDAEALAGYLLTPEVEATLAGGPSAQIPLLKSTSAPTRVETPQTIHAMSVDFEAAARLWDRVAAFLDAEFSS
jgi:iron(III) transport system substrate-binding protein